MATPDYNSLLNEIWGWPDDVNINPFLGASGVIVGSNPAYTKDDFLGFYPKFKGSDQQPIVPPPVIDAYIALASAHLVQARWQDTWKLAMALFIAHFLTLYLQSEGSATGNSTKAQIAQQGIARGIAVAKSVDGVSVSYQKIEGLEDWAAWQLTTYGQLFATFAKGMGSIPMLV